MTDGIRTWTGISGSADRPKSLQIDPSKYLETLKGVLRQPNNSDGYQVTIAPRNKAVVLTIKLQQLRFFQKSFTADDAPQEIQRQLFERIALRSDNMARDNQQLEEQNASLRFPHLVHKTVSLM